MLEKNRERLKADAWLLGDGPVHQSRRMQLFFGARGVSDVEITVYGPARALHSGHYGNWAPNPAVELAQLAGGPARPRRADHDRRLLRRRAAGDGRPSARRSPAVPDVDAALRDELALAATEAGGARLVERIMLPALNLRGLASGAVGATAANAIPTDARASIDFRLVPDQTPARVRERFEAHLRARGFRDHARRADARRAAGDPAARPPRVGRRLPRRPHLDGPAVLARAGAGRGRREPAGRWWRCRRSGAASRCTSSSEVFRVPVVGLPIANHDNNQHGADENLRLQNLWDGIAVYAGVLAGLGDGW